jgi:hypothetical protein
MGTGLSLLPLLGNSEMSSSAVLWATVASGGGRNVVSSIFDDVFDFLLDLLLIA